MTQFIAIEAATDTVHHVMGRPDPAGFDGVVDLTPFPRDGLVYRPWQGRVVMSPPTPGSVHRWVGGAPRWIETEAIDVSRARAIAATYADVDAVYVAAIGARQPEYDEAETLARAYLAAEAKPSPASEYITSHATNNPTGAVQTEAWAAQQIVERADAFRWAKRQMRTVRFASQGAMRTAPTHVDLAAAVGEWNSFITWLRTTLGL